MSTRLYPLYQKGAPQLRVYLPNFWLKLVRPNIEQPKHVVQFMCSMEMTRVDVKNYLEKIYNVKCAKVNIRVAMGKTKADRIKGYITKDDDIKYAYVHLLKGETFEFPEIFEGKDEKEKEEKEKLIDELKESYKKFYDSANTKGGAPGWFSY